MLAESPDKAPGKSTSRSKVTNGSKVGTEMDGRTIWVRRLRDLIEAHEQDLGGTDNLNQAQRSLVRRAATLSVELERMEATFATAGKISAEDLDSYQRASNTLRRHLEVLGLPKPESKAVAPPAFGAVDQYGRVVANVRNDIDMYGACVGREQAKLDAARRIAYAVAESKRSGEPISEDIEVLAVKLRVADLQDGDAPVADEATNAAPEADDIPATTDIPDEPPIWQDIKVKAGGLL